MRLAESQDAIARLCTARAPDPNDLAMLGDERVWLVYRSMVRKRLRGELSRVFKRSARAVGEVAFRDAFDAAFAAAPPTSRFFYRVPLWFADAAAEALAAAPGAPPHVRDMLRYEVARWEVADLPGEVTPPPGDFDFESAPVFSPALRLLHLEHAVHRKPSDDGSYGAGDYYLAVHRAADDAPVRTWTMSAVTHDLIASLHSRPRPIVTALGEVAASRGVTLDAAFVDKLCGVLADFLQRGVILGSR